MQAIDAREVQRAEPSQRFVLVAAGALLTILCLLVLVAAALNGSSQSPTTRSAATVAAQPATGGSGQADGSNDSQPDHGFIP
jgi:hypothetical protein